MDICEAHKNILCDTGCSIVLFPAPLHSACVFVAAGMRLRSRCLKMRLHVTTVSTNFPVGTG
jgi:hypothetical protein